jgi:hypothetical protein
MMMTIKEALLRADKLAPPDRDTLYVPTANGHRCPATLEREALQSAEALGVLAGEVRRLETELRFSKPLYSRRLDQLLPAARAHARREAAGIHAARTGAAQPRGPRLMTDALYLWQIDDGESHSVIAADEDDALRLVIEFGGAGADVTTVEEYRGACCDLEITQRADDFALTVSFEDAGDVPGQLVPVAGPAGVVEVTTTAREWIANAGRRYLGGSCW